MTSLPKINTMKFGIIDQNYMNTLSSRSDSFADMQTSLQTLVGNNAGRKGLPFLAKIDENDDPTAIATYGSADIAWRYEWAGVTFEKLGRPFDEVPIPVTTEFTSGNNSIEIREALTDIPQDELAYAYNLSELSNIMTSPIVFGVDMASDSYPEGFAPIKVGQGSFVWLQKIMDSEGGVHYIFDRMGTHDGTCEG